MLDPKYATLLEEYYGALRKGDVERFWQLQTDDIFYNWSGHTPISGRMQGKARMGSRNPAARPKCARHESFRIREAVESRLRGEFARGGDHGSRWLRVNGVRYDQRYVHMFEFRGNQICEIWEFFDTALMRALCYHEKDDIRFDSVEQGRPVGLAIDKQRLLLVADDVGNTVWRVSSASTRPT